MAWSRDPNRRRGVSRETRTRVMYQHHTTCHVCRHPGANHIDHIINWAVSHDDRDTNLAPIHGTPCPTCGRDCHREKTKRESLAGTARHSRRRPAERHPGDCQTPPM